ncbi:MAG TPA: O-methyltransferase [Flavobacteriales bacterium]|nr:O-methyltransferase [Flavobacteriales bacterium]
MEFIEQALANYCNAHTSPENEVLQELNRETNLKIMMPRMLSGHLQGRFLSMLTYMIKPKRVLEIGTYTGYSALCFAEALDKDAKIITIDINAELEDFVRGYFLKSMYNELIDFRIGNALEVVPTLNETFDLVFIDADKENYLNYYHLVFDKVKPGGFILADNVLWSGKILQDKKDKDTRAICEFNDFVMNDSRVEKIMAPVRDGIYLIRKK